MGGDKNNSTLDRNTNYPSGFELTRFLKTNIITFLLFAHKDICMHTHILVHFMENLRH